MNFVVEFYKRPDGIKPVADFIKTLEMKMKAKVRLIWQNN